MTMVYITGDLHGSIDVHKLTTKIFPEQKQMNKDDYLIICGDFGFIWAGDKEDAYWLKWLDNKPFTTLFVDGNHENFDLLNTYTISEFSGGKVHKVSGSVYHLMRGQVYTLGGRRFFTMGGAESTDKEFRKQGISWWEKELPSEAEYEEAMRNLKAHGNVVDYIVTHCAPDGIWEQLSDFDKPNKLTAFLATIKDNINYGHWYFGHYHKNEYIDDKHTALYREVLKLC